MAVIVSGYNYKFCLWIIFDILQDELLLERVEDLMQMRYHDYSLLALVRHSSHLRIVYHFHSRTIFFF